MLRNKGTFFVLIALLCSLPLCGQIIGAQQVGVPPSQLGDIIHVKDFGANGEDDPRLEESDDTEAIQAAINAAQNSGRKLSVMLGAGIFRVSSSLNIAGDNRGIAILGSPWASLQQGNAPPASTILWTGGAAPVFNVTTSFTHFVNFSIVNEGGATSGIEFSHSGRVLLFGMTFTVSPGFSAFSKAAAWFVDSINYDMIDRCEFEVSPAIKITADVGTTLEITRSVFDIGRGGSGANPLLDVDANIELLKIERNTFNFQPNAHIVFDNSDSTKTINAMRVVANEFDGNAPFVGPGSRIILGANILNQYFGQNSGI